MLSFDDPRLILPAGGMHQRLQARAAVTAMRKTPHPDGTQVSQVLLGETVLLHHEEGEFGLVQCEHDRYVGWVLMEALSAPVLEPSHHIVKGRIHAYSEPKITAAATATLGIGAKLTATGAREGRFIELERIGWVVDHLLSPISTPEHDAVSVAERFIGTPYLWGGRDCLGLDCSGLVQIALEACGFAAPRDSDMQSQWLGVPVAEWQAPGVLQRGDLIYWKGHIGFVAGPDTLLHANGTFMTTMSEPLDVAIDRIAKEYGEPQGARRINAHDSRGVKPDWLIPRA